MKIAIVTIGTRGDVQPYIALGCALQARGHEVRLACHDEFAEMVRGYGLEHRTIRGNFGELLQTEAGRGWLTSADAPLKYGRFARQLFEPLQVPWCEDADAAMEGVDGVVFYTMAMAALHGVERRKLPGVVVTPWPMVPTRDLPPAVAIALEKLPAFTRVFLTNLVIRLAFSGFNAIHQQYRASVGLPPYRAPDTFHCVLESGLPIVHLFSEVVIPRPTDWQDHHAIAGFAFAPAKPYDPPASLVRFLESGPTPIYLGFGSMTGFEPQELADLASRAAKLAGVRAIVARGWAGLAPEPSDDVYVIDEVPHDWLFPRVSAVVHHGGVGTFAEGLRAGKPTVIAAFFGDQPFWGLINERLGTGPRALRRKGITAENLATAIRDAVSNPSYRARAEEVSRHLRAEDGAARAAEMIEQRLSSSTLAV
jgi:sterol 3beta-glucosyltransferase